MLGAVLPISESVGFACVARDAADPGAAVVAQDAKVRILVDDAVESVPARITRQLLVGGGEALAGAEAFPVSWAEVVAASLVFAAVSDALGHGNMLLLVLFRGQKSAQQKTALTRGVVTLGR